MTLRPCRTHIRAWKALRGERDYVNATRFYQHGLNLEIAASDELGRARATGDLPVHIGSEETYAGPMTA